MHTLTVVIFLLLGIFSNISLQEGSYNVALVEYLWDDKLFPQYSPLELGNLNARKYNEFVEKIKDTHGKIDLVVFPEGTLVSNPLNTSEGLKGMTFVPTPEKNVIPCNNPSTDYANFFKLLSCTARNFKTYLVVNLKEKANDDGTKSLKFYNTAVVFDRNGKVVARYRKYNVYLRTDVDKPSKPDLSTFTTDFGETFGIFTGFDVNFEYPAIKLARDGVKNLIFLNLWIPELPFHNNLQLQQMIAYGNDVNVFGGGAAYPAQSSGALGIFLGKRGALAKSIVPRSNYYLFQEVPIGGNYTEKCEVRVNDTAAREWDQYTSLYEADLSDYVYKKLDIEKTQTVTEKLCQKNNGVTLCCDFRIEAQVNDKQPKNKNEYKYFVVARNGLRTYGHKTYFGYIEICALIACTGSSISDCSKRYPNYNDVAWPITFNKIQITGNYTDSKRKVQMPNTVLADFSPIPPTCTTWKTETGKGVKRQIFSTDVPVTKLLTFSIFGRKPLNATE